MRSLLHIRDGYREISFTDINYFLDKVVSTARTNTEENWFYYYGDNHLSIYDYQNKMVYSLPSDYLSSYHPETQRIFSVFLDIFEVSNRKELSNQLDMHNGGTLRVGPYRFSQCSGDVDSHITQMASRVKYLKAVENLTDFVTELSNLSKSCACLTSIYPALGEESISYYDKDSDSLLTISKTNAYKELEDYSEETEDGGLVMNTGLFGLILDTELLIGINCFTMGDLYHNLKSIAGLHTLIGTSLMGGITQMGSPSVSVPDYLSKRLPPVYSTSLESDESEDKRQLSIRVMGDVSFAEMFKQDQICDCHLELKNAQREEALAQSPILDDSFLEQLSGYSFKENEDIEL